MSKSIIESVLGNLVSQTAQTNQVNPTKPITISDKNLNQQSSLPSGFKKPHAKFKKMFKILENLNKQYEEAKNSVNSLKDHKPEKKILLQLIDDIDNHPENLGMDITEAKSKVINDLIKIKENRKIEELKWKQLDTICEPLPKEEFKEIMQKLKTISPELKHEIEERGKRLRDQALESKEANLRGAKDAACNALKKHRNDIQKDL